MPFDPTPEQQAVIEHPVTEHGRLFAGPGTGKSAIIVHLISRLLNTNPAPRIRLLTFTRAATAELAHKVSEHPAAAALRPSTVHSFAIATLIRNPGAVELPEPIRIADDWEQKNIVGPSLAVLAQVQQKGLTLLLRELSAGWESLTAEQNVNIDPQIRARFLGAWTEHRTIFGYTLLSELPYQLRSALRNHDDLQAVDFNLLIVDEYQDLNACDLEVLHLIANRGCKILAAGDDDQSIYSMRKAAPQGIRRFPTDYPQSRDYPLSIAQRYGRRIIEWASHVIEGDLNRPLRPRLTAAANNPEGEVAFLSFAGQTSEARGIAQIVQRLTSREQILPQEILVLLRSDHNAQFSTPIKQELRRLGIEYSDPDAHKRILAEESNRMFLEMLRILDNSNDSLAWASVLKLTDGIGQSFFDGIYAHALANRVTFAEALQQAYQGGFNGYPRAVATRASRLIHRVRTWCQGIQIPANAPTDGWGLWATGLADGQILPVPSDDLRAILTGIDSTVEQDQTFNRYLGQIAPIAKDRAVATSTGVRIMTLTNAKGLTVEAAIIAGLEEGIVPLPNADLAEERRLLYVGMTRARRFLFGTWAGRRRGPTARSGRVRVGGQRSPTPFLDSGPVVSEPGGPFISNRWP